MKSHRQLKQNRTSLGFKSTGFWRNHYTISAWENQEEMKKYSREGAHLQAMKASRLIAREIRTLTYEDSELPVWKDAKEMVRSGRVIFF